jgi:cytochrome c oxidase subunit 2
MLLRVIVEPRADFDRWVAAQKQPPAVDASVVHGRQIFESTACVNCHTIQGTAAVGRFGPDLTHLMTRVTIGAGVAMNTRDHLRVWVDDPNVMKPGALMPAMNLGDKDLDDLVAYLATLH